MEDGSVPAILAIQQQATGIARWKCHRDQLEVQLEEESLDENFLLILHLATKFYLFFDSVFGTGKIHLKRQLS